MNNFTCKIDKIRVISGYSLVLNFDSMTEVVPTIKSEYYQYHDPEELNYTLLKLNLKLYQPFIYSPYLYFCLLLSVILLIIASLFYWYKKYTFEVKWSFGRFIYELFINIYTLFVLGCIFRYTYIYLNLCSSVFLFNIAFEAYTHVAVYFHLHLIRSKFYKSQNMDIDNYQWFHLKTLMLFALYLFIYYYAFELYSKYVLIHYWRF